MADASAAHADKTVRMGETRVGTIGIIGAGHIDQALRAWRGGPALRSWSPTAAVLFLSGDDAMAKAAVAELFDAAGFVPIDLSEIGFT
jgi:hypothetical protein